MFGSKGWKINLRLVVGAWMAAAIWGGTVWGQGIDLGAQQTSGSGWTYNTLTATYTITGPTTVDVTGSGSNKSIVIEGNATINLNGASVSGLSGGRHALDVEAGGSVTLKLTGSNTLMGGPSGGMGIRLGTGATTPTTLTIEDGGTSPAGGILTVSGVGNTGNTNNITVDAANSAVTFNSNVTGVTHTRGILINGTTVTMAGDVTLPANFAVPSGRTLTIPAGATLTIPPPTTGSPPVTTTLTNNGAITIAAGGKLVNKGNITNPGTITVAAGGELVNEGAIASTGTLRNNGTLDNIAAAGTITGTVSGDLTPGNFKRTDQDALVITPPGSKGLGAAAFPLATAGGSGTGTVTYALSGTDNAGTVTSAGMVTVSRVGEIKIVATKAADNNYNSRNSGELTITVTPGSLADATVTVSGAYTYNGSAHTPPITAVTVTLGGKALTRTTDYVIRANSYSNNIDAGANASFIIDATSPGNYTGSKTATFTISPKALAASMLTFPAGATTSFVFSGSAHLPEYVVTDAAMPEDRRALTAGTHYTLENTDRTSAGSALVSIKGMGNYTGTVSRAFSITRKALTINADGNSVPSKVYDGGTRVDTSAIGVAFEGRVTDLLNRRDYTITASYNNANAGERTVSFTVALTSEGSKNYSLTPPASFTLPAEIHKRDADTSDFTYTIPQNHRYTGAPQGMGNVAVRSGRSGMGTPRVIHYDGSPDKPVEIGEYSVTLLVPDNGTNYNGGEVFLGTYSITAANPPVITANPRDTTVRQGNAATLRVTAASPDNGTLRYQWFTADGDTVTTGTGAKSAAFSPNTGALDIGTHGFYVEVTNVVSSAIATVKSETASLTVIEPAKPIDDATVTITGEYAYGGYAITPAAANIIVTIDETALTLGTHYTCAFEDNVDAGVATITVNGIDEYKGSVSANFTIAKRALDPVYLQYAMTTPYSGAPRPLVITARDDMTGLGAATILYNGASTPPTDAGEYEATLVSIAEGSNFTALTPEALIELGTYTITVKTPVAGDFTFEIPDNHLYTGNPQGIGAVTLPGTGYGSIRVLYDGEEDLPVDIRVYAVTVVVEGGNNYAAATVALGNYEIKDPSAVAENAREIGSDAGTQETAAFAPIKPPTAGLTAGPNPAGKGGVVNFYYNSTNAVSGSLIIYDAAGNVVNKIALNGNGTSVAGNRRQIGSWNLKDSRGKAVAEGTYLAKGTVTRANGKRERVSLMIGVR